MERSTIKPVLPVRWWVREAEVVQARAQMEGTLPSEPVSRTPTATGESKLTVATPASASIFQDLRESPQLQGATSGVVAAAVARQILAALTAELIHMCRRSLAMVAAIPSTEGTP